MATYRCLFKGCHHSEEGEQEEAVRRLIQHMRDVHSVAFVGISPLN